MSIDIEELKKLLKTTKEINDKYANGGKSYSFEMQKENFENEKFEPYKDFSERIQVSNLGRVKFDGEIQEQTDEKSSIGYLYLKNYHKIQEKLVKVFNDEFVYEMVVNVWLPKHTNDKCIYDIHHKDNDGYNNTVDNLILLKRCEHKAIHPFMKLPETCENCRENILLVS